MTNRSRPFCLPLVKAKTWILSAIRSKLIRNPQLPFKSWRHWLWEALCKPRVFETFIAFHGIKLIEIHHDWIQVLKIWYNTLSAPSRFWFAPCHEHFCMRVLAFSWYMCRPYISNNQSAASICRRSDAARAVLNSDACGRVFSFSCGSPEVDIRCWLELRRIKIRFWGSILWRQIGTTKTC